MKSNKATEVALRAAAAVNKLDMNGDQAQVKQIQDTAVKAVTNLVTGSSNSASLDKDLSLQKEAIALAVFVLYEGFQAISSQLKEVKHQRLEYEKERLSQTAFMIIPTNREEQKLSKEQTAIRLFIEETNKNNGLTPYFGIQHGIIGEDKSKFYSVLPYSSMSSSLGQQTASCRPLDVARKDIRAFLDNAFPEALKKIDTIFQTSYMAIEFGRSIISGENYLNDLRAPRLIMMSLANLIWHLQHPVDARTGFPLSVEDCIALCRTAGLFVNRLLIPDGESRIFSIAKEANRLLEFIQMIEIHIKSLHEAYEEELTTELNITDLANRAHEVIRRMDTSIFELVFIRKDPVTGKRAPDPKAAGKLANLVSSLNLILKRSPDLVELFSPYMSFAPNVSCINLKPTTVMDVLIILCHMPSTQRDELFAKLTKGHGNWQLFASFLEDFHANFFVPIKKISAEQLKEGRGFHIVKSEEARILASRRLIPLLTLLIEDYGISVDTERSVQEAEKSKLGSCALYTGKQQVQYINSNASSNQGYYRWELSAFIKMKKESEELLDKFPKTQYRLTQVTRLLDSITELVYNYRSFLQHKGFQEFLKDSLHRVKAEFTYVEKRIGEIDDQILSKDDSIARTMIAVIGPMMTDLNTSLAAFDRASEHFRKVVSSPDFTDHQKQLLEGKLDSIAKQYQSLFNINLNTRALSQDGPSVIAQPVPVGRNSIKTSAVVALKNIINQCENSLSYQSRFGHKGALLNELTMFVDRRANHLTYDDAKKVILSLTRISASYRPTWFFQAGYGETRSAKALIGALKNSELNAELPLMDILFGENSHFDYLQVSEADLLAQMKRIAQSQRWETSVDQIEKLALAV